LVIADNWQPYDNFESGTIDTLKWQTYNDFGGNSPFVLTGKCVLSGIDTDGTTEAGNWEDAASNSIYAEFGTKAVKCDFAITPATFNNDPGQGQVGDFYIALYADLDNGMFCSIKLSDSGSGLNGVALVEDSEGQTVSSAGFVASYGATATYAIEIHESSIMFKKTDTLLLSWQPVEEVGFTGFSMSARAEFCEYNATIDNVLVSDNPDYGNSSETAYEVTTDGTTYYGVLETSSDLDWFVFTPIPNSRYRITFANAESDWKYMYAYQKNALGNLIQQTYTYGVNSMSAVTLFFEEGYECYFKITGDAGNYFFTVEYLDTTPPDSFSDSCETATPLAVGATVAGTLDHVDGFSSDWFLFNTQAMHKYQISLTRTSNSDASFLLYPDNCGTNISSYSTSYTLISWFGENYKLRILGNADLIGHYYTIKVTDLGLLTDDWPNSADTAATIPTDGSMVEGNIQYLTDYHSDEDWFVFTPIPNSRYRLTFANAESDWKYVYIYQKDALGNLIQQASNYAVNSFGESTVFFENGTDCFIKMIGDLGSYSIDVEYLDTTPPDSYSNDCSAATPFAVGTTIVGTLDHSSGSFDVDWLVFNTQAMHKYQITMTRTANSDSTFLLYPDNCGTNISGYTTSFTLVSWFSENYKLRLVGNSTTFGHYYTINVTDLGLLTDDWANTAETSLSIPKDGTWIDGILQYTADYHTDKDWFKLIAPVDGSYLLKLKNTENNWKYLYLYRPNEIDTLVQLSYTYAISNIGTATVNLTAGTHYIKIEGDMGGYQFSVLSPEPRCGDLDHPYPMGDVNKDCYFDMADISMMAADWLSCTNPNPPCGFVPVP